MSVGLSKLQLSGGSQSRQMIARNVGEKMCMFDAVDSEWSCVAPTAFFPGLVEGDSLLFHFGWVKAEIVDADPAPSIIKPPGLVV